MLIPQSINNLLFLLDNLPQPAKLLVEFVVGVFQVELHLFAEGVFLLDCEGELVVEILVLGLELVAFCLDLF
jgi:hypothetical protein